MELMQLKWAKKSFMFHPATKLWGKKIFLLVWSVSEILNYCCFLFFFPLLCFSSSFFLSIHYSIVNHSPLFKKYFISLFILEIREGREKERERNTDVCQRNIVQLPLTHTQLGTWPTTQACALNWNQWPFKPVTLHRRALNPLNQQAMAPLFFIKYIGMTLVNKII